MTSFFGNGRSLASTLLIISLSLTGCGSGEQNATQEKGTFAANVVPLFPPPFSCPAPGPVTQAVMQKLNTFWQSAVVACVCAQDSLAAGCLRNAVVFSQSVGYIYFDRSLLVALDQTGSTLPGDFVMAHEFGHNIQIRLNLPSSGGKFKELQADCLGGYYIGWLVKNNQTTANDVARTFGTACNLGDPGFSQWWERGAHGTCSERISALQGGISGYLSGVAPGQACPSV